ILWTLRHWAGSRCVLVGRRTVRSEWSDLGGLVGTRCSERRFGSSVSPQYCLLDVIFRYLRDSASGPNQLRSREDPGGAAGLWPGMCTAPVRDAAAINVADLPKDQNGGRIAAR